jgi:glycosyltransferase involved in cell wall biosynthesis
MSEAEGRLRILLWHVHGSWTTSFVHGGHEYLIPRLLGGGPWGRGKAGRDWPSNVREVTPGELCDRDVDVVILQRPEELELVSRWLGRRPGHEVAALYVEHNTPRGPAVNTRHPLAEQTAIPLVHVTHFNDLVWDNGRCPTTVVAHGVVDPGPRYTGERQRIAVMINEPVRRGRITGTDLLPTFAEIAPIDVYGIAATELGTSDPVRGAGDLRQPSLYREVAAHRLYLHTARWTSLGLSLIEAMHLGMPVVCLATTEAVRAVPIEVGVLSTDIDVLRGGVQRFIADPGLAVTAGKAAREFALANYGLDAFLTAWDGLLGDIAR